MVRPLRRWAAGVALAALVAPTALLTVTDAAHAGSVKRHDVVTYKREGWVALGDTPADELATPSLACEPGDVAVDGVWKVDAHDGDDRSLRVLASYGEHGDAADVATWRWRLLNTGTGRAQVKLFVTCLELETGEAAWHRHHLVVGPRVTVVRPGLPAAPGVVGQAGACDDDQVPVAPGFELTGGTAVVTRSMPAPDGAGWEWGFDADDTGVDAVLHLRCLDRRTTVTDGHVHEIDGALSPVGGTLFSATEGTSNAAVSARRSDEGLVGAFSVADPAHVWYLGQDPQGQVRASRYWYDGAGSPSVTVAVWGIDKRTGRQLRP